MKKFLLIFIAALAVHTANAQDDKKGGFQNAIKLNPLSLVFATGNIAYERAVADNQTLQIGVFYSGVTISDLKYTGLGITPEYRFYFGGKQQAFNGIYAGPFVRYQSFRLEDKQNGYKADFSSFGGGAVIGWEKAWASGFVLDLFAGPAYNSGKFKNSADEQHFDVAGSIDGFGVRTGITLGFAF